MLDVPARSQPGDDRGRLVKLLADFRQAVADLLGADQRRGTVVPEVDPVGLATLLAATDDGLLLHAMLDPDVDLAVRSRHSAPCCPSMAANAGRTYNQMKGRP